MSNVCASRFAHGLFNRSLAQGLGLKPSIFALAVRSLISSQRQVRNPHSSQPAFLMQEDPLSGLGTHTTQLYRTRDAMGRLEVRRPSIRWTRNEAKPWLLTGTGAEPYDIFACHPCIMVAIVGGFDNPSIVPTMYRMCVSPASRQGLLVDISTFYS